MVITQYVILEHDYSFSLFKKEQSQTRCINQCKFNYKTIKFNYWISLKFIIMG